jgi:hypothetical protein
MSSEPRPQLPPIARKRWQVVLRSESPHADLAALKALLAVAKSRFRLSTESVRELPPSEPR